MVYNKHSSKSRKYKKNEASSKDNKAPSFQPNNFEELALPQPKPPVVSKEKKSPPALNFLSSLFGSREKNERSGKSLFNIMGHDIYLDDLLLLGLILLLMTDKVEDEILLIILLYLLLDIF